MAEHEMIDLLDDNGNTIGTIDKAIAHRDGLWHRSVHVWIVNDKNEILLQQRCASKKFFPNVWDCSFAGHIAAGESSLLGAEREGEEELGIVVEKNKLKFLFTNREKLAWGNMKSNEFVDIFLLKMNIEIKDIVIQKEEVGGVKWVSLSEFFEMTKNKDEDLLPHISEYEMLSKLLVLKRNNVSSRAL